MMRSVCFVDRLEFEFSGNHFSSAITIGDVNNDGVSNCWNFWDLQPSDLCFKDALPDSWMNSVWGMWMVFLLYSREIKATSHGRSAQDLERYLYSVYNIVMKDDTHQYLFPMYLCIIIIIFVVLVAFSLVLVAPFLSLTLSWTGYLCGCGWYFQLRLQCCCGN